jgi:hypothetical protein
MPGRKRLAWYGVASVLVATALVAIVVAIAGGVGETTDNVFSTLLSTAACGLAALGGVALLERRRAPSTGRWLVAAGPTSAVAVGIAIWSSDLADNVLVTLAIVLVWELAMVASIGLLERRRLRPLVAVLPPVATTAAVLWSVPAWWAINSDAFFDATETIGVFATAPTIVATLRLLTHDERLIPTLFAPVSLLTTAAGAVTVVLIWMHTEPEPLTRALLVLLILIALGYLLTPIVQRLRHDPGRRPTAKPA